MKTKIEKFLEKFPKDATSWANATDEIRDLSRTSREYLEDYDEVEVEPVNFKAIRNPAEWNTKGRESIIANFDKMTPATQQKFYDRFHEWFEAVETKSPAEVKREKMIQKIYNLHAQAKKTDFGEHLISHIQLVGHLAKQPTSDLGNFKRFYEGLLETYND